MKTVSSNRIAVLVLGLLGIVALGLAARTFVLAPATDDATIQTPTPARPATDPATDPDPSSPAAKPKLVLLPGLPKPVDHALRSSRIVLVSLYAGTSPADRSVVGNARRAARNVGVGFVAINAFKEKNAKALQTFAGTSSVPVVLVVRRPGTIVKRFEGFIDEAIAAQAARNAGARRR